MISVAVVRFTPTRSANSFVYGGETVLFALDGNAYEIDLSTANASSLRDALTRFVEAGRRVAGTHAASSAPMNRSRRRRGAANDNASIRQWAASNGYAIASRGRIPENVVAAYQAAK